MEDFICRRHNGKTVYELTKLYYPFRQFNGEIVTTNECKNALLQDLSFFNFAPHSVLCIEPDIRKLAMISMELITQWFLAVKPNQNTTIDLRNWDNIVQFFIFWALTKPEVHRSISADFIKLIASTNAKWFQLVLKSIEAKYREYFPRDLSDLPALIDLRVNHLIDLPDVDIRYRNWSYNLLTRQWLPFRSIFWVGMEIISLQNLAERIFNLDVSS